MSVSPDTSGLSKTVQAKSGFTFGQTRPEPARSDQKDSVHHHINPLEQLCSQLQSSVCDMANLSQSFFPSVHSNEVCACHAEALAVYCRDDQKKVCSHSALFGEHKGHQVFQVEDARKAFQSIVMEAQEVRDAFPQLRGLGEELMEEVAELAEARCRHLQAKVDSIHSQLVRALEERATAAKQRIQTVLQQGSRDLLAKLCRFDQMERRLTSGLRL